MFSAMKGTDSGAKAFSPLSKCLKMIIIQRCQKATWSKKEDGYSKASKELTRTVVQLGFNESGIPAPQMTQDVISLLGLPWFLNAAINWSPVCLTTYENIHSAVLLGNIKWRLLGFNG